MVPILVEVLVALWAVALFSGYAMGGLIHILLGVALIAVVLRFVTGQGVA